MGQAAFADAQRWNARQLTALEHCLRGDQREPEAAT